MEKKALSKRLHNWVLAHRWYRQQGHAFSLEGRFRSNRGNEKEYDNGLPPPPPPPKSIDVWDAWEVELAWRELPGRSRWCVKYHYHDREHPGKACRLILKYANLVLRQQEWRNYMREARFELTNELDARAHGRKLSHDEKTMEKRLRERVRSVFIEAHSPVA